MENFNVQLPRSSAKIIVKVTICIYGKNRLSFALTLYIISNVSLVLPIKFSISFLYFGCLDLYQTMCLNSGDHPVFKMYFIFLIFILLLYCTL